MQKVKPKKALGQHFLTDTSIARRIADTLSDYVGLPILEIGPGMGMLTQFLLECGHNLDVVEIDKESVEFLEAHFPQLTEHIHADDFLKMNLRDIFGNNEFGVIGNYPYNISSQIFFKILDYKDLVKVCSGMLQREVAERIAAEPGSKARGILSILVQAWYDVEYLFTVNENVFNPPPKVKSGVIRITRNNVDSLGCDEKLFRNIVKTTFGMRRKTLRNSLKPILPPGTSLNDAETLLSLRPEQLSVEQFIELTNKVMLLKKSV